MIAYTFVDAYAKFVIKTASRNIKTNRISYKKRVTLNKSYTLTENEPYLKQGSFFFFLIFSHTYRLVRIL